SRLRAQPTDFIGELFPSHPNSLMKPRNPNTGHVCCAVDSHHAALERIYIENSHTLTQQKTETPLPRVQELQLVMSADVTEFDSVLVVSINRLNFLAPSMHAAQMKNHFVAIRSQIAS